MRRCLLGAFLLSLILLSCAAPQDGPEPAPAPTDIPSTQTEATPHAAEIRIALVGEPTGVNAWALFDRQGAGYPNFALMNEYWPRLYALMLPDLTFTPRAANGIPTPVIQEGGFFTSTVTLRSGLKWTDGLPLTADDVAFTVNTALAFEFSFDWKAYYSPDYLERAEAVDTASVKFYFKRQPNVGVWQYGALQGPILQKAYWESRIEGASALLPGEDLRAAIADAQARIAEYKPIVDKLGVQVYTLQAQGKQDRGLEVELKRRQGDLDEASNDLSKAIAEYADKVTAARQALYALEDADEPTLGVWMPAGKEQGNWINLANPDFPFEKPNFDRVVYLVFASEKEAIKAFEDGRVDVVLTPNGGGTVPAQKTFLNGSARFLAFNPSNSKLVDPALRQAMACMIWLPARDESAPLSGFILPGNEFWRNVEAVTPCADLTGANLDLRLDRAVQILKSAGYAWTIEPAKGVPGAGLVMPDGQPLPAISLLSPSEEYDPLQAGEAARIEAGLKEFGIPINIEYVSPQDVRYLVFSSKEYNMAILGWRLSLYPGYLCEWFGAQGQFDYNEANPVLSGAEGIKSGCDALAVESDLESARQHVFAIQSILARGLPFIPLYADVTRDAFENVHYPFENLLGGLSGSYGAPSFAIPPP